MATNASEVYGECYATAAESSMHTIWKCMLHSSLFSSAERSLIKIDMKPMLSDTFMDGFDQSMQQFGKREPEWHSNESQM